MTGKPTYPRRRIGYTNRNRFVGFAPGVSFNRTNLYKINSFTKLVWKKYSQNVRFCRWPHFARTYVFRDVHWNVFAYSTSRHEAMPVDYEHSLTSSSCSALIGKTWIDRSNRSFFCHISRISISLSVFFSIKWLINIFLLINY